MLLQIKLVKFNPFDGTSILEFTAPAPGCTGLTFDGENIWIANNYRNEIYQVSPQDGNVIILTSSPNEYPRGMAYDGNYLWLVDSQSDTIYQMKKVMMIISLEANIELLSSFSLKQL